MKPTARIGTRVTMTLRLQGPPCTRAHRSAVRALVLPLAAGPADLEDLVWGPLGDPLLLADLCRAVAGHSLFFLLCCSCFANDSVL